MPAKRDDYEDEEDSEDEDEKKELGLVGKATIITGVIFLIISEVFIYLLSSKTSSAFGINKIIFGLIVAITITLFLLWINLLIRINRYLGAVIGIAGTGAMIYALRTQFEGAYTNIFTIISTIVALGYIFIHFWKSKNK